jgi:hypothetical protein
LKDLIVDFTGMRRFFEIKTKDILDWDYVNGMSVEGLWRSVNEWKPSPLLQSKYFGDFKDRQEILVARSSVQEFIEDGHLDACRSDDSSFVFEQSSRSGWVKCRTIYAVYRKWMRDQSKDAYVMGMNKFGEELRKIAHRVARDEPRKQGVSYYIPDLVRLYEYSVEEPPTGGDIRSHISTPRPLPEDETYIKLTLLDGVTKCFAQHELPFDRGVIRRKPQGLRIRRITDAERAKDFMNKKAKSVTLPYLVGKYFDFSCVVRVEYKDGTVEKYRNSLLHCSDGPAVTYSDGEVEYWEMGLLHRVGAPAVIKSGPGHETITLPGGWKVSRCEMYYSLGRIHRAGGPAVLILCEGKVGVGKMGREVRKYYLNGEYLYSHGVLLFARYSDIPEFKRRTVPHPDHPHLLRCIHYPYTFVSLRFGVSGVWSSKFYYTMLDYI